MSYNEQDDILATESARKTAKKKKQCCWEKDPLFSGQSHGDHPMKTYVLIRGTSDVEAVKNVMFGENGNLM